jgi:ornithine carbamoyltransferase
MKPRHFLDIDAFPRQTLRAILDVAHAMKVLGRNRLPDNIEIRPGAVLAMIFEQPSTRTRVSFEVAMHELGGTSIMLSPTDMQIGRGETIADTARVLSRYVDAIMIRTGSHGKLLELAAHAAVPVVNGLTNLTHPSRSWPTS